MNQDSRCAVAARTCACVGVIAALRDAAGSVWQYGDPENYDLKAALAAHHGVQPANIVVGVTGSCGLASSY